MVTFVMHSDPKYGERDPVCEAIETFLHGLEIEGRGIEIDQSRGTVRVEFGGIVVEAATRDIALVRLANSMMDDPRYSESLIAKLRQFMQAKEWRCQ